MKKWILIGLGVLVVIIISLIVINLNSDKPLTYVNNGFVVSHLTSKPYNASYSQYDYLKYEFYTLALKTYEFDVIIYNENNDVVLDIPNISKGNKSNMFYFDIYLDDLFVEGDYRLKVVFRDLTLDNNFEITEDFNVDKSRLLMSEPVATSISEGELTDYRRIPMYFKGENINVYYQTFNMEVVDGKTKLITGFILFDDKGNLIVSNRELAYDNIESGQVVYKYFNLDTTELESGVYYLIVKAVDDNAKSRNEKVLVFKVI